MGTAYGDSIMFSTYKSDAVTDVEGNYYNIVGIGTQTWMVENLKVTHFRDGTSIPNVTNNSAWKNLRSSGYSRYNSDFFNL